jgi:hypothetical protein
VHSPQDLIRFLDDLLEHLSAAVAALPFDAPSGFEWYPFSRFELHVHSIRHTQHHAAQLIERARAHHESGFNWVAGRNLVGW